MGNSASFLCLFIGIISEVLCLSVGQIYSNHLWVGVLGKVDAPSGKSREGKRVNNTVQGNFGNLSFTVLTEERRV